MSSVSDEGNVVKRKRGRKKLPEGTRVHDSPLWCVYKNMKDRCYRKNNRQYKNYGGRGIYVCDEWKKNFRVFERWAVENGWKQGLDIDRFPDNDGPYSPDNCRVTTRKENCNNKSTNIKVVYRGVAMTYHQLARLDECVVNATLLSHRLRDGWPIDKAVTRPAPDRQFLKRIAKLENDSRCTVSHNTVLYRIKELGWDAERAAFTPSMKPWLKK